MFKKPNLDTLTKSRQKVYTSKLLTYLSNNGEQDASEYLNFLLNQKEEASTQKIDTSKLESIDAKILKVLEKIEKNMIDEQDTSIKRKGRNGTGSGSSDSSNGIGNANGLSDEDEEGSGGGGPGLWLNRVRKAADKRRKEAEKKKKKEEKKKKKEEQKKNKEEEKKKKEEEKKNKSKDTKSKDAKPKTPKNQKSWRISKLLNLDRNAVPSSGDQSTPKTPKTQKKWRIGKLGKLVNLGRTAFNASTLANAVPSFSSSTPNAEPSTPKTPKTEPKPVEPKKPTKSVQKQENDIKKAKTETAKNIKQEAKTVKASEGTKAPKVPKLGNGVKSGLKAVKGAGKALGAAGALLSAGVSVYEFATAESSAERMDAVGEGVGGFGGAMAGAALGATIGSIVPGVGTLIGGAVGGLIGGFLGSELGKGLMDWLKDPEDYVPDEIKEKGPEAILMYIDQVMYPQYIQGIQSGDMDPDKLDELADYRNEVQSEVDEKNKEKEDAIKNYQDKITNPKKETSFLDKAKDFAVSAAKNSLIGKAVSFGLGLFSGDDSEDSKDPEEEKAKETAKENIEAEASKGAEKESESIFSKVGKGLVKSIPIIGTAVTGLEIASSALSATNLENDVIDIDETLKLSAKEIKAIIDNKNLDDFTKKRLQEDYKLALQIDAFKNTHKDVEPSACVFLLKAKVKEAQTSLEALSENDAFSRAVLLDTIKMYNNLIEYYSNIKYDEKQFKVDFDKLTTDDSVKKSSSLEAFSGPSYSFLDAGVQGTSSQSGQPGQSVDLPPLDLKPSNAKFDENAELGILSKKYEAPGGVGTVSTGVGDPGGVSYGSWQLSTNAGTLGAYLKDTPDYAKFFGNARPGTPEFTQRWKEIAKADPKGFEKSQHDFLYRKNFKGVLDYATSKGIDTSSKTIQNVLWSQAIQHGLKGNKTIINNALKDVDPKNNEEVIKAIYQSRSNYVGGLKMDGRTKASCIRRYKNEGSDALAMLANEKSGKPQVKTDDKTSSSETNESTETKAQVSTSKGDTNAQKTSSNNQQNTVTVKEQAALTAMQTVQNNINNNNNSNTNVNANEKEDENKDHPKTAFIIKPLKGKFDF